MSTPTPDQSPASRNIAGAQPQRQLLPPLIERVKAKLPLLEYVSKFREMKPTGNKNEYVGRCINSGHEDVSASFYVNSDKQVFHCKGCGVTGNVVQAYGIFNGLDDEDAKFALAREIGVLHERRMDDSESTLSRAASRYVWQLERHKQAMAYLTDVRKLTPDTIKRWGIGFCWGSELKDATPEQIELAIEVGLAKRPEAPKTIADIRHFMGGRVTFPISDASGRVIGFAGRTLPREGFTANGPKYLNSPETKLFKKSEVLFGAHAARAGISRLGYAAMVEGYMDVVACHQHGADNTVAAMGAFVNETTFKSLWELTNRVVFCLDGDKAGEIGAHKSVMAAAPTMRDGCEIAITRLPQGVDPDEYMIQYGLDAWNALCERAVPLSVYLMEERASHHDLSYPEGRAMFLKSASDIAGIFANAPMVRDQILAEARAINAAALVDVALGITGLGEKVTDQELRDGIKLLQRRLLTIEKQAEPRAPTAPKPR